MVMFLDNLKTKYGCFIYKNSIFADMMMNITLILAMLVALEHLYIMYLETFATQSDTTARVFSMPKEKLSDTAVNTLFKNQGVYNGLIAVLLFIAVWRHDLFWVRCMMGYVVAVAAYGSFTSNPKIILKQGSLAILALVASWL